MERSREAFGVQSLERNENNAEWALSVHGSRPSQSNVTRKNHPLRPRGALRPILLSQFNDG